MSSTDIISAPETIPSIYDLNATSIAEQCGERSDSTSELPAWLTKDYLENCLKSHYRDSSLVILKMDVRRALGKGENYGGILTRITTEFSASDGKVRTEHYIVKTSFEADEFSRTLMEPYDIFNREMAIYENVLPKLNALLREIGDDEQIFAETMSVDYERSALIFEDLNVREYVMPNRLEGLDMKVTKIILRKLAKMHATSAVLNERENGSLESYDRGMFNRYTENYAPCFVGLIEACSRLLSQWEDYKHFATKLTNLKPLYMELGKRVFDPTEGHINVFAHGDLWTNNVMVKYDKKTGEPVDVILIDFQYSVWTSPAVDLFYFFNTSLKKEMQLYQQDELIQYYYTVLADTLRKLKYKAKIPSLHSFHIQMEEKAFYALNAILTVQPIQRNENTKDADFKALMSTDERAVNFKNVCYKNVYCQRIIKELLPVFERKGLLDLDQ